MIGTQTQREAKSKVLALGFLVAALIAASFLLAATPADADATFTVNKTGDAKDAKINGNCDTSPKKKGKQCTLRAAIQEANATVAPDTIRFKIPASRDPNCDATTKVCTISPASALPPISWPTTIDGYSQGSNTATTADDATENTATTGTNAVLKIVISGSKIPTANGLTVESLDSTIKGLVINGFEIGVILFPAFDPGGGQGNRLQGNFIGTDATGTTSVANNWGVFAFGAANQQVEIIGRVPGFNDPAARNLISGNRQAGINLGDFGAGVRDNLIGTKADGTTALGNGAAGLLVQGPFNTIEGNTIAFNSGDGVEIEGDESTSNWITSNSIFSNGGLGIDLKGGLEDANGRTANDGADGDTGPNNLQNYPDLSSAQEVSVLGTQVEFNLNSTPNKTFFVQFFSSPEKDPSGFGEGKVFLGQLEVTTDGSGNTSPLTFTTDHPAASEGNFVTATALLNPEGDTSEFSLAVEVDPPEAQQ